jgi:hypothetical protein
MVESIIPDPRGPVPAPAHHHPTHGRGVDAPSCVGLGDSLACLRISLDPVHPVPPRFLGRPRLLTQYNLSQPLTRSIRRWLPVALGIPRPVAPGFYDHCSMEETQ